MREDMLVKARAEIEVRVHTCSYVRPIVTFSSKTTLTRVALCRNMLQCVAVKLKHVLTYSYSHTSAL